MNNLHKSDVPGAMATTTEELIVQYLDGELVRKELETMLFERLAESAEARGLLREYLTMRGAIRTAHEDDCFQLSSDLDDRTRIRIEQMLEQISAAEPVVARTSFAPDAAPVRTNAVARGLKRWTIRPSIAALALLLAVGTTWLLTRESEPRVATVIQKQAAPASESSTVTIPGELATANTKPVSTPSVVVPSHRSSESHVRIASQDLASNSSTHNPVEQRIAAPAPQAPAVQPAAEDPADIMLSHRYAKILNATEKREVVVTSRDRL